MNIDKAFIKDPKTGESSVSLTLMLVTFMGAVIASVLEMCNLVESTSLAAELFYATSALYFGRRFNIGKDKSLESGEVK